ncbi:MAG: redoxin [Planctomycetes bacterium]|nr:redoxin [Planctomycetota bacterium]
MKGRNCSLDFPMHLEKISRGPYPLAPACSALLLTLAACSPPAPTGQGDALFRDVMVDRAQELDPRTVGIGKLVADLEFKEIDGSRGRLSDHADRKALVIVMRQIGCPVSDRYGPRIARLEEEFSGRGVDFMFVNADKYLTVDEVREEVENHGFRGRYVHDADESFVETLGADTTTTTFVLDASRTLRYRGAVDDQIARGTTLPEVRRNYLRDALESVLANEPVAVSATSAPGCALGDRTPEFAARGSVTYHGNVARILQSNCVECHRTGGAAPFSLETFEDAYDRRRMMGVVVPDGQMPPWLADDTGGPWLNDRRLSVEDKRTLLSWIEAGAPEGDPADGPVPLEWKAGWVIGEPDFVFQLGEEKAIPAEGVIDWDPILADVEVPHDMWVKALQVLPTDPEVVHHATVTFRPPKDYGKTTLDALMSHLVPWTKRYEGWQFLFGYLPGKGPRSYADDVARFLPKGSLIRFDMHYTPKGVKTRDRTRIGVVLAEEEPIYAAQTRMIRNWKVKIPPHAKDVHFSKVYTLESDVLLRSLVPHMHYRGHIFHADLLLPDGTEKSLIRIPEWNPDWQFSYVFRHPPLAPTGSQIRITGWFDNSDENPFNPDPTRWVHDGPQIWDEMLMMATEWIRPRELQ